MTVHQIMDARLQGLEARLQAGLEREFGPGAGAALAQRFLNAEEADFLWEARLDERWLGAYFDCDERELELDRVAIIGRGLAGWFVAISIVDGEGQAQGLSCRRRFAKRRAAREAFDRLH